MASKTTDKFSNVAAIQVVESAANTLTSLKFNFPFSIMDKMALIIGRMEYMVGNLATGLNSTGDYVTAALTVAASVADISNQADPLIVDSVRYSRVDYGAAASGLLVQQPYVKDFTNLPGGGALVAPAPLYAMIQGNGAAVAFNCWMRLYYTYVELSSDEYWQLVESRRIISS